MFGEVTHLDAILPQWVEITTPEQVYRLRGDIGAVLGLYGWRLSALANELPNTEEKAAGLSIAEISERTRLYQSEVLALCGECFRATPAYAEMTDADVAKILPPSQREELVRHFFTLRSARSQTPASAPDASATASTMVETDSDPPSVDSPTATDDPSGQDGTKKRKH